MATTIKSSKLKPKLVKDGFEYTILRTNIHNIRWKCPQNTCQGKISTNRIEPYNVFTKFILHNHNPKQMDDKILCAINTAKSDMKQSAINNKESTNQILLSTTHQCNDTICSKLGNSDVLRRMIRRARRKYIPEEPKNTQFSLPDKWKTTMSGEQTDFLIYDNENEHRILIFATSGGLSVLSSANLWFMDGTFKCSCLFAQLYVIRAEFEGNVRTCVYAFLPDKLENTYQEMLLNLIIASVRNNTPLKPERIIIDFELGVINAINRVFNGVQIHGCFFHLCQSVWRQIQQLGLAKLYKENEQIAKECKMITSLAFLPIDDILNEISKMYVSLSTELLPLISYFDRTYISGNNGSNARYPPSIWNVRAQTMSRSHRTNNYCEGWNSTFNKLVGTTNPSFWTVLRAIQLDESASRLCKGPSKSNIHNDKLFKILQKHEEKQITNYEFLNEIYYTCSF